MALSLLGLNHPSLTVMIVQLFSMKLSCALTCGIVHQHVRTGSHKNSIAENTFQSGCTISRVMRGGGRFITGH